MELCETDILAEGAVLAKAIGDVGRGAAVAREAWRRMGTDSPFVHRRQTNRWT